MSEAAPAPEATKPCPACGESIKAAALKCRFCGEDLQAFAERLDASTEKTLFDGHLPVLPSIGAWGLAIVTLGVAALVLWVKSRALRLEVTSQRIRVHRGLFSRALATLELFRVDDLAVTEPVGMRMLGNGILTLRTSDRDQPTLTLHGVRAPHALAEQLRRYVQLERQKRGLKVWTEA